MKRFKIIPIPLFLLLVPFVLGAELRKEDVSVHRLDNGLKVVLLEDHDIPNIAYYTFFRVGSRNERPGITGVSHFIEHMMFNGTQKFGPGEFDRIMEASGGANNAGTGNDMTSYTNWYPAATLERMIELDADRMQGLIFDPKVLESERGVIASERRLGVENDNEGMLSENVQATAIMAHPYHWDVIGWMSDILSWKRDEIMAYYRTFYSPNNAVIVAVGDFRTATILDLIKKYYGGIPKGPEPPAVNTVEPPQMGPKRVVMRKPAQTPSFQMVYHGPAVTDLDFPGLDILGIVLLQGESSRLYRRLVAEEQLAIDVSGGLYPMIDPFLFSVSVKPKTGADLDRMEKVIEEEFAKIKTSGIEEKELKKALNTIQTDFYSPLQTIAGKAGILGRSEILYGGYEHIFTAMDKYNAVTLDEIKKHAVKYFTENNKTVGLLIPEGGSK